MNEKQKPVTDGYRDNYDKAFKPFLVNRCSVCGKSLTWCVCVKDAK